MKKKMSLDSLSCHHHYAYFIFICFIIFFFIQLLTHFRLFSWTRESYECSEIKRFAPLALRQRQYHRRWAHQSYFCSKTSASFWIKKKEKKRNKMGTKNITPSWNVSIKNYQKWFNFLNYTLRIHKYV